MPCAGRIIAVFTPMTSPAELTSGPPELPGFSAAAVGKVNDNSGSAVDDMAIGQNEAVGRDDESRSASRDVARPILAPLLNFDVHDGRRDPLGCAHYRARIFVKQRIATRNIASVS